MDDQEQAAEGQGQGEASEAVAPRGPSEESLRRYPNYYRLHKTIKEKLVPPDSGYHPVYFDRHDDDEGYDRITIETVPRWKSSYMSGDEWRFSYVIHVWWKGFLVGTSGWSSMDHAIRNLDHVLNYRNEEIQFKYKQYSDHSERDELMAFPDLRLCTEYCAQPGCPNFATHTFIKKDTYCTGLGNCGMKQNKHGIHAVRFCAQHAHRGDCDLEDADANLELFEALCERGETHRYVRELNYASYFRLEPDEFGQGQIRISDLPQTETED